eukprot:5592314-Amphidinium_carterae.1
MDLKQARGTPSVMIWRSLAWQCLCAAWPCLELQLTGKPSSTFQHDLHVHLCAVSRASDLVLQLHLGVANPNLCAAF